MTRKTNPDHSSQPFDPIAAFSAVAGALLVALGIAVMFGWFTGNTQLVQITSKWVPMQFNTALGFLGSGLLLVALKKRYHRTAAIASLALATLGFTTALQYLLGVDFGIDELFIRHEITVQTTHPGRMAPNTAIAFLLLGLSGLSLAGPKRDQARERLSQILSLIVLALAVTALIGYVLEIERAYGWRKWTSMAMHTAAGLTLGALAVLEMANVRQQAGRFRGALWLPGLLYGGALVLDLLLPLGFAAGAIYVPLVLCSLAFKKPPTVFIFAALSSALILVGYVASEKVAVAIEPAAFNRISALIAVWLTATVVYLYSRTTANLSAHKRQLELALEGGRLGLWDWWVPTGRVDFSRRWAEIVGYEPSELARDFSTWQALVHPDDSEQATRKVQEYLAGERPSYVSEFRMRHKDGDWRWIQARGKIVETDEGGEPLRVTGTHLDVTSEKENEQQLRLLQEAIDQSESAVLVTSPDPDHPIILHASKKSPAIFGLSAEALTGSDLRFLGGTDGSAGAMESLVEALRNQSSFETDLSWHSIGGEESRITLHAFPILDPSGNLAYFGIIGYDITEEHEARLALRHEEAQFRSTVDFSPIGIALVAPDGRWLRVNDALCEIVGYSKEELLASDFQTITHPDDLEIDLGYLQEMLDQKRKTYEMEKRYIHKDGHIVWILLTVSLVWNTDGTPSHFISQIQDISKRKEDEEKLDRYLEELKRSNRELDDFAYIASHDLKEPLRAIGNHSQILIRKYSDRLDDKAKHKLERLVVLTGRMEKLISDLLFFSRLGRSKMSFKDLDLAELVEEQTDLLDSFIGDNRAQVHIDGDAPTVHGDSSALATVFRNLIANGIKYNDSDEKRITIRFEQEDDDESGPTTICHVQDNGIGIEEGFHEDIFRMFKRLHGDKAYGEGTGSGLTFVKKIIEQHGGRIWLTSSPGTGTTFHFTIPGGHHGNH